MKPRITDVVSGCGPFPWPFAIKEQFPCDGFQRAVPTTCQGLVNPTQKPYCRISIIRSSSITIMDITSFVISRRENALLLGDYNSYRAQLSRRLLTLRKKLGRTTPKGKKYTHKAPIIVKDISGNHEYARFYTCLQGYFLIALSPLDLSISSYLPPSELGRMLCT